MKYFGRITGELNILADRLGRRATPGRGLIALVPVLAAVVAYAGTLGHEFAFDDVHLIAPNERICGDLDVVEIFRSPYWAGTIVDETGDEPGVNLWRPVTILSHAVLCQISGPDAFLPHALNLVLHALNAWLLFLWVRLLFRTRPGRGLAAATAVATLFAVHPLNSEVVYLAVGRADLLATGCLLALCFWVSKLSLMDRIPQDPARTGKGTLTEAGIASGIFGLALVGMLSKEVGVLAPGVAMVSWWATADRQRVRQTSDRFRRARSFLIAVLPAVCAVCLYLVLRTWVLGAAYATSRYSFLDNPLVDASFPTRLHTGLDVLARYLGLFLSPIGLSTDYSVAQVEPQALLSARAAVGILAIVVLAAVAVRYVRRLPLATAGTAWFLMAWIPVSNIPFPIGTVMGERLCYLPFIGLLIVLVSLWLYWREGARNRGGDLAVVVLLATVLGAITVTRGHDFTDNCTLFESMTRTSPRSAKARFGHGICLLEDEDRMGEAVTAFDQALKLYPDYEDAVIQLAQVLERTGHPGDGLIHLEGFLSSHPKSFEVAFSLAKMRARQGQTGKARNLVEELRKRRPDDSRITRVLSHLNEDTPPPD